jgi:hypothetical protein
MRAFAQLECRKHQFPRAPNSLFCRRFRDTEVVLLPPAQSHATVGEFVRLGGVLPHHGKLTAGAEGNLIAHCRPGVDDTGDAAGSARLPRLREVAVEADLFRPDAVDTRFADDGFRTTATEQVRGADEPGDERSGRSLVDLDRAGCRPVRSGRP